MGQGEYSFTRRQYNKSQFFDLPLFYMAVRSHNQQGIG